MCCENVFFDGKYMKYTELIANKRRQEKPYQWHKGKYNVHTSEWGTHPFEGVMAHFLRGIGSMMFRMDRRICQSKYEDDLDASKTWQGKTYKHMHP